MRKKFWEMTLGILYIVVLFYQLAGTDMIKLNFDFPVGAETGCRVRAVIDLPGNRKSPLDFTLSYDGDRLVYCKAAGREGLKGLYIVSRLSGTGEMLLEISAFAGNDFWGGGRIILEFYIKKPCRDICEFIKVYNEKSEKSPLPD